MEANAKVIRCLNSVLNVKVLNQKKTVVGAFPMIEKLRQPSFQALEQVCGLGGSPAWQSASTSDLDTLYGAGEGYAKLEIFPGGLLERVETGEVGPTFSCLIRRQFEALRAGDRFFFTHSNTGGCHEFSRSQQQHLMKRTLRDVICDNTEVARLQARVMEQPSEATNPVTRCPASSSLDVKALLKTSQRCCGGSSGGSGGGNKPNKGKGNGGKGGRH